MGKFSKIMDVLLDRDQPKKQIIMRRYNAARPSRIAGGFTSAPGLSGNEDLRSDLRGLIAHSRQQNDNNDYLRHFNLLLDRNVLGPSGIKLVGDVRMDRDKSKKDKQANLKIERGWKKWGRFGNPTVCGEYSWRTLEKTIVQTTAKDGGLLLREYKGRNLNAEGYQLQVLEVDYIDFDKNEVLNNGGRIVMGVEMNRLNKIIAYWLFDRHPGERTSGRLGNISRRVPAEQIIYCYSPERPGNAFGVPWAHTALRRLNMVHGYEEAAITAARAGAAKMGFFTKEGGAEVDLDLLDGLEDTEVVDENGNLVEDLEPGSIETLPEGYSFTGFDPKYPDAQMEAFMKVMLRAAAAGLGVAYSSLANDLEKANFSSLRAGLTDERDGWRVLQNFFRERVHERVYDSWLNMWLISGLTDLPASRSEKFSDVKWRGRGWEQVNPQQESQANQIQLQNGTKSPQQIVAERGDDLEDVYDEIAEAKRMAEERELDFSASLGAIVPEPNAE